MSEEETGLERARRLLLVERCAAGKVVTTRRKLLLRDACTVAVLEWNDGFWRGLCFAERLLADINNAGLT